MITGTVNAQLEATIRLTIHGPAGQQQDVEAVVDTGFTGALTLPPAIIASLGLAWDSRGTALMANGSLEQFDIYSGTVIWDGAPRNVLIESADTDPLVGTRLLDNHELRIEVTVGGRVTIEALP
jgi:clan AA aspartic protease